MKIVFRLVTACLLVGLTFPHLAHAGGGMGEDPYEIGEKLYARRNFRTALKYYERALKQNPDRSDAAEKVRAIEEQLRKKADKTSGLLEQGKRLFKEGKYRKAEKVLLQAAARDKSNAEIHFYLGEVYLQREDYGKAKSEYIKAKRSY